MKILTYEKSVFPCSVHFAVNIPAWRPKDTNVTFTPSIHRDNYSRKNSKLHNKCQT